MDTYSCSEQPLAIWQEKVEQLKDPIFSTAKKLTKDKRSRIQLLKQITVTNAFC